MREARKAAIAVRAKIDQGIDPRIERLRNLEEQQRLERELRAKQRTFKEVADDWLAWSDRIDRWHNDAKGRRNVLGHLNNHILPHIGSKPIGRISTKDCFEMLKRIYLRPSTYSKIKVALNHIFKYAIIHELIARSPMDPVSFLPMRT